jgi:DNA-binding transcriptional regulator YdaS (Cro superfamily)
MSDDLKRRLVTRACEIAGGRERLASRIGVETHALEFWLSGRATPPERVFLSVVDLVLEDDMARAVQDRRRNAVQRMVFGSWSERRGAGAEAPGTAGS